LLAAVIGFAVARSGGGRTAPVQLDRHASNVVLRIAFPADWHRRTVPAPPLLGMTDELALASRDGAGVMLVVGRALTSDPTLLPSSLLKKAWRAPRLFGA
jgi:hypothetical protein